MTQNELNDIARSFMQDEISLATRLSTLNVEGVDQDHLKHAADHFDQAYEAMRQAFHEGKPPETVPPPPVDPEAPPP
jgi:hypothetical protein